MSLEEQIAMQQKLFAEAREQAGAVPLGDLAAQPGEPALGQGGSGDLLAGYLAGLLAQPLLRENVSRTIRFAAWQHGAAADVLSAQAPNWVVEDLAKRIGSVRL